MASKYKGYMGKILDVDLSSGKIGTFELSDRDRERFVGGRFISTKIMLDELKPGIDPLSSDNILIVMTSPLTGTGAPSTSRYDISAKSPQTGAIGHSNSGGNFGIHLKKAGWDGIVIRGKAKSPVYIDINNDIVKIEDAAGLWGKDTEETKELMGDKKAGKMVIGPAGEHLVKYSMERLYNLREGFTAKDDTLPRRFTHEEQIPGNKKSKVPLDKMLPRYYRLRGWDSNGVPTKQTLKRLDLEDIGKP